MTLSFLGAPLQVRLSDHHRCATHEDQLLYIPLPPDASARQIQDSAEAWLRARALEYMQQILAVEARNCARIPPAMRLSFAAKGAWVTAEGDSLRCNWRLIQQHPVVIQQALRRGLLALPAQHCSGDLFATL